MKVFETCPLSVKQDWQNHGACQSEFALLPTHHVTRRQAKTGVHMGSDRSRPPHGELLNTVSELRSICLWCLSSGTPTFAFICPLVQNVRTVLLGVRCIGTAVVTESRKVCMCTRLGHHIQTLSLAGDTETSRHLAGQNQRQVDM